MTIKAGMGCIFRVMADMETDAPRRLGANTSIAGGLTRVDGQGNVCHATALHSWQKTGHYPAGLCANPFAVDTRGYRRPINTNTIKITTMTPTIPLGR
jgi:hypothetical protein